MVFGTAFWVEDNSLENLEHFFRAHEEAGFFQDLSAERVCDSLAGFDQASGEGPIAF